MLLSADKLVLKVPPTPPSLSTETFESWLRFHMPSSQWGQMRDFTLLAHIVDDELVIDVRPNGRLDASQFAVNGSYVEQRGVPG